jgi:hypothetical protein
VQDSFFSLTFQSTLNFGALLFGVFGFLYSVYAMNSNVQIRPPIVKSLRLLCRIIAVLIAVSCALSAYSLHLMLPFGTPINWPHTVLASGLMIIGVATSLISLWIAFEGME